MTLNRFDQAARYTVKLDPNGSLSWWLRLTQELLRFRHWLDTRGIIFPGEPERTNDTVAWLADEDPAIEWAIAIEFSHKPDVAMSSRLLVYLGHISLEKRPTDAGKERFHVGAIVVNLTGVGKTSRQMSFQQTNMQLRLHVEECNLSTWSAAETLGKIRTGELQRSLLPWIPLLHGADTPSIIDEWKRLAAEEPDHRLRSDYAGLAVVFAEAAGRWELWKEALKEWNMVESLQVLEWMAQGEARGEERGEARGEARGETNSLLRLLEKRFAPLPSEFQQLIRSATDLKLIRSWFDTALEAGSLEDFRTASGL